MFISPLAIIYICYVFYILINSKSIKKLYLNMFVLTCILEISMLKGYFIIIGGAEISILSMDIRMKADTLLISRNHSL